MTDSKKFGIVPIPEPCESCLATLIAEADNKAGHARMAVWCPHNLTLTIGEIRQRGDERAVIQWTVRGPIGGQDAQAVTDAVAKETGSEMVPLDGPKLH